jgi:hypothetical protein
MPGEDDRTHITPAELADKWGVTVSTVLVWINTGQLRAINVVTTVGLKRRWRIALKDLAEFEECRASRPASPRPERRPRRSLPDVPNYFR